MSARRNIMSGAGLTESRMCMSAFYFQDVATSEAHLERAKIVYLFVIECA
jgi:hypothetical protein